MKFMDTATLRLGMGQMRVECGDMAGNLDRAQEMIHRAAADGCRIVVLPECLDLGWTFPDARHLAEPIPGRSSDAIQRAALENGVYVAAGLTERAGDRIYNAAVLVSPQGQILLKHRKINELDIARGLYSIGNSLGVAETEFGVAGVNICADNFPDSLELAHSQARMGCKVLLSPSAWAVGSDHDNSREPYGDLWINSYTTLARSHNIAVVGVSNVGWLTAGPWQGRKCIGCSLAVGPGGRVLAQGPYGEDAEAMIPVEIPLPAAVSKASP